MKNNNNLVKIFYGENKEDYLQRYIENKDNLNGYLSEAKAFDLFFDNMIMCNDYLKERYNNIDILIDSYDEESDTIKDEYQFFIVDFWSDEELITKIVEKMGNTLYYDSKLDLYIMGVCDLGTSRTIVPTNLKIEE